MATRAARVLEAALELPTKQRGRLIAKLLASLEGPPDARSDAEWRDELSRRAAEVRDGTVRTISWETAKRTVRASLKKGR